MIDIKLVVAMITQILFHALNCIKIMYNSDVQRFKFKKKTILYFVIELGQTKNSRLTQQCTYQQKNEHGFGKKCG